jgi:putative acetyltransferase
MYFARNSWFRIGSAMMTKCLETAKTRFGNAIFRNDAFYARCAKLYRKVGFENINAPMGSTGHTSCPVDAEKICKFSNTF